MTKNPQNSVQLAKTKIITRSKSPLVGVLGFLSRRKTPAPHHIGAWAKKAFALFALFLLTFLAIPITTLASYESDLEKIYDEIEAINDELSQKKKESKTLANEIYILNQEVYQTQLRINATLKGIAATDAEIQKKNSQIADAELRLTKEKSNLGELIRVMYEEGQSSTIEIIAKSGSFNEYVNRTEYLEQIQLKVKIKADAIVTLKNELGLAKKNLEEKKVELQSLRGEQQEAQRIVLMQRSSLGTLLSVAKGDEAAFQKALNQKKEEANALEQALEAERSGGSGSYGNVPQYFQTDPTWKKVGLNGTSSTIGAYGCGVSSIAMVLSSYGYYQTPKTVGTNSRYFWGSSDLISWGQLPYATGYRFKNVGNPYANDYTRASQWASIGKPFIVYIKDAFAYYYNGRLYHTNHFVVIVGTSGGRWIMNDPVRGSGLDYNKYYGTKAIEHMNFIEPR
jgi:peptidoglycan hydrolase CwlO-like protein